MIEITDVQKYNKKSGTYEACKDDVKNGFKISTEAYLDGLPAVVDDPESDMDDHLNKSLGGPIVAEGPVFTITVENESLPKELLAVEVQLTFEAEGEAVDLQRFAYRHTAGLEEYREALQDECEAKEIDGQLSTSRFSYTGGYGSYRDSAFCKLLEFERLTDELLAAGAVAESNNKKITFRLIIDNR